MVHPSVGNRIHVEKLNFAYSFRPVYYFLQLFGLWSFSIISDSNGEIKMCKVTKFDGLWFIISLCTSMFMAFLVKNYAIATPMYVFGIIFGMLCCIYSSTEIIVNMWNRYKLITILKKLTIFDKEVIAQLEAVEIVILH